MEKVKSLPPEVRQAQLALVRASLSETLTLEQVKGSLARLEAESVKLGEQIARLAGSRWGPAGAQSVTVRRRLESLQAAVAENARSRAFFAGRLSDLSRPGLA